MPRALVTASAVCLPAAPSEARGRVLLPLCLLLLVVLAGCNGLGGFVGGETTQPAANGTALPEHMPPGVANGTLEHPIALAGAHDRVLRHSSYRFRSNVTVAFTNGTTVYERRTRARVGRPGDGYRSTTNTVLSPTVHAVLDATHRHYEAWSNGTVAAATVSLGNATANESYALDAPLEDPSATRHDHLYLVLAAARPSVAGAVRGPAGANVVLRANEARGDRANDFTPRFDPAPVANVTNVTLRAVVQPNGVVRSYTLAYDARWRGERVHVHENASFTRVNETTVTRPGWVDAAIARSDRRASTAAAWENATSSPAS